MARLGFDLVLLGAPAAGKDTQADILRKRYRLKAVESGKHWRKMSKQDSAEGRLLRRTFGKGHPAPVRLMKRFLQKELKGVPKSADLLFIGNPRLKPEAQLLNGILNSKKRDYLVVGITLPAAEIRKRSLKRMRDDQDWKFVGNRIKMYRLQVSKTLSYFKSQGKLKTVNGNRPVKQVAKDIQKAINDHQGRKANSSAKGKRENPR